MTTAGVRFGVVGTNWITEALIRAGRTVQGFEVTAALSRSEQKGAEFAQRNGIGRVHTVLAALAADAEVDAVYIASPNMAHAPQATSLLAAGKHVLCEKPLASSAAEARALALAAQTAGVLLMEAYVAPFEPNVAAIAAALPRVGVPRRAVLVKDQFSSRYPALLAGELPNAFNPAFAAGSTMDIGIYPVALAHHLFGRPQAAAATGTLLPSGVDGTGTILLAYDGFEVACLHSKIVNGPALSWIAGEDGLITFDDCSVPTRVTLTPRGGDPIDLTREQSPDHMRYEVEHFIETIRAGRTMSPIWPVASSLHVLEILDAARASVGVLLPGGDGL